MLAAAVVRHLSIRGVALATTSDSCPIAPCGLGTENWRWCSWSEAASDSAVSVTCVALGDLQSSQALVPVRGVLTAMVSPAWMTVLVAEDRSTPQLWGDRAEFAL